MFGVYTSVLFYVMFFSSVLFLILILWMSLELSRQLRAIFFCAFFFPQ